MHPGWAGAATVLCFVLVYFGHFQRFTWWGMTQFALYCALKAGGAADGKELYFATIATLIMVGVIAMSALHQDGSMLATAYRDYGPLLYFIGTFSVHYMPWAVIVASSGALEWSMREVTLMTGGLAFFAVYLTVQTPSEIYGVSVSNVVASAAGTGLLALGAGLLWAIARHHRDR